MPKQKKKACDYDCVKCKHFVLCLQAWADAFRSSPDLTGVVQIYEELKRKGVEFPMADLDALSPIHTPQRVRQPCHSTHSTIFLKFISQCLKSPHIKCTVHHFYAYDVLFLREMLNIHSFKTRMNCYCYCYQGVPEIDPASHKYKASLQPKPASQPPQTSAASSLPAQNQIANVTGPVTPNAEQVSLTVSHCVLHCLCSEKQT